MLIYDSTYKVKAIVKIFAEKNFCEFDFVSIKARRNANFTNRNDTRVQQFRSTKRKYDNRTIILDLFHLPDRYET